MAAPRGASDCLKPMQSLLAVSLLVLGSFVASGCAEAPAPKAPEAPMAQVRAPGEELCASQGDPTDMKVCRAEARLRAARKAKEVGKYECYDDRVGQMHAAVRERDAARGRRREQIALGYQPDEGTRVKISEQRVSEIWDHLQSGICDGH